MNEQARTTRLRAEYDRLYGDADPTMDHPSYRHWLEQKVIDLAEELAEYENDETPTRRELNLRIRQGRQIVESMMPYAKHMAAVDWGNVNDWLIDTKGA